MICQNLNRLLAPEVAHHLFPKLTTDAVLAKQSTPEGNQMWRPCRTSPSRPDRLDDIDDRLLDSLHQAPHCMRRPFVFLVDLPRCNHRCELEVARTYGATLTVRDPQVTRVRVVLLEN